MKHNIILDFNHEIWSNDAGVVGCQKKKYQKSNLDKKNKYWFHFHLHDQELEGYTLAI
jgi:hypothetical protein